MRFKLILQVLKQDLGNELPINYQYELSSAIYKILSKSNASYSHWLHENGFIADNKRFKLFTFSHLVIPNFKINKERQRLIILSDIIEWYISFLPEKSTQKFIEGVFMQQSFQIGDKISTINFAVREVQALPPIHYKQEMYFDTISPICISHRVTYDKTNYLSPTDSKFSVGLLTGVLARYKAFFNKDYDGELLYRFTLLSSPKSALLKIKANTPQQIFVKGYRFRFKILLPEELMRIMYESGVGEKTSIGFGMVKEINPKTSYEELG